MEETTLGSELIFRIVHPSMRNYEENKVIQTIMPTWGIKIEEFEVFLLNCVMIMIVVKRTYPEVFKREEVFIFFTVICKKWYLDEGIYNVEKKIYPETLNVSPEDSHKVIFEKWGKYEKALEKFAKTHDTSEVALMLHKSNGLTEIDKKKKKMIFKSMDQTMKLINKELPLIISKYL